MVVDIRDGLESLEYSSGWDTHIIVIIVDQLLKVKLSWLQPTVAPWLMAAATALAAKVRLMASAALGQGLLLHRLQFQLLTVRLSAGFGEVIVAP